MTRFRSTPAVLARGLASLLAMSGGCGAADPAAPRADALPQCLPAEGGYLRAQLRGAVNADLDWRDAQIRCDGGARPDGSGLRVSIAGPLPASAGENAGRTLRFVFGIETAAGATEGSALATNVTAIIEGDGRGESTLFATRGDDKCTTDHISRRDLDQAGTAAADGAKLQGWRVEARGFCLGPANTLDGTARVLLSTFDFAARVNLESR